MEVRHEFPDFHLDTRQFKTNTKQDRYKGLTYDYMRWFIGKVESEENAPAVLEGLESLIALSKGHSTCKRYPTVKKWFLNRYPEFAEFGMTEEQLKEYRDSKKPSIVPDDKGAAGELTELPAHNAEKNA